MKLFMKLLCCALALFASNAFAAWTVVSDGTNPQVTDGNWVIQLNSKYKAKFISKSGTTTEPAIAFRIFKDYIEKRYCQIVFNS